MDPCENLNKIDWVKSRQSLLIIELVGEMTPF